MIIDITLKGEPKSTNNIYKYTCIGKFATCYLSNTGKAIKEDYYYQIKKQYNGPVVTNDLDLIVKLYFGTKRKHDIDNFTKLAFDSLTGIVWKDDSQIQSMIIEKCYDRKNPRIDIIIDVML